MPITHHTPTAKPNNAAKDVSATAWNEAHDGFALPPQWTEGGHGDVTAAVVGEFVPITIEAPISAGFNGPYALHIEPAGAHWTGAILINTGDIGAITGNGYAIRIFDEVHGTQQFDVDAWGSGLIHETAAAGLNGASWKWTDVTNGTVFEVRTGDKKVIAANLQVTNPIPFLDITELQISQVGAPADGDVAPSTVVFWLDDTPGATVLHIKAMDSGGTVRTGSVNLT